MKFAILKIVVLSLVLFACDSGNNKTKTEEKGDPAFPPLVEGKADFSEVVTDSGHLRFGQAESAVFVRDLQFFGWRLTVRPGARVRLETSPGNPAEPPDTVLYVFGPRAAGGGYGAAAIAFDDDSGNGLFSRVDDLLLTTGGEFLVVVGTFNNRGRGDFHVEATCLSSECTPEIPVPDRCHPAIAEAILDCVADLESDPNHDPWETPRTVLIEICTDAEIVAPAWDALCAGDDPPEEILCDEPYEVFATEVLPACRFALVGQELDTTCIFGNTYGDIWNRPGAVIVLGERTLTIDDDLTPLEQEQILEAVKATAYDDVTTLEEAFDAVDEGLVHQTDLWDASSRRAFTSYEVGAGDNSFGMIFHLGTLDAATRISDGDLMDCTALWGPEMRPCGESEDCSNGAICNGHRAPPGSGRCIDITADDHPSIGAECSESEPCPTGSGLVCAGGFMCNPAWMRGRFVTEPERAIPDNLPQGVEIGIPVFGLATVSMDVTLDLVISHERPADLVVTVINPEGTEVVVWDRQAGSHEIYLRFFPVYGFPGDESANGVWTIRVQDTAAGATGFIRSAALTITSRWD